MQALRSIRISRDTSYNITIKFPQLPVLEDEESPLGLLLKEKRLQAELVVWRRQLPSVLSTDPNVLEDDTLVKVSGWTEKLQRKLKVVREERERLTKELEGEKQLLGEARTIEDAPP